MRDARCFGRRPSHRLVPLAVLAAVLVAAPARGELPPALQALVARSVEAYGGVEALRAVHGWQQLGKVSSPVRGEGAVARIYAPPGRLRVEHRFARGSTEIRILDGERGWRNGTSVQGPPYQAMVLQAARLALPLILLEGEDRLVDGGLVERDGARYRRLELPLREGMQLGVEIDPETGRIHRSRGVAGQFVFETAYSDWRPVGGVLFAFTEETSAMGQPIGRTLLEKVVLLGDLPDGIFEP